MTDSHQFETNENVDDDNHSHSSLHLDTFMKRRKKKLVANGKSISVPKKALTAYAIFVKKKRKDYQDKIKKGEMK